MALFPMIFPFFFDLDTPVVIVYPPFRPLAEEGLRAFTITVEEMRSFVASLEPLLRLPDDISGVSVRSFDASMIERAFGVDPATERGFFDSLSSSRVFVNDLSVSRSFDDDVHEGRN